MCFGVGRTRRFFSEIRSARVNCARTGSNPRPPEGGHATGATDHLVVLPFASAVHIQIGTDMSVLVRKFLINGWLSAHKPPYQLFAYQDLCGNNSTTVA
ncbi:unnamed protein product [Urochloa humidicola]